MSSSANWGGHSGSSSSFGRKKLSYHSERQRPVSGTIMSAGCVGAGADARAGRGSAHNAANSGITETPTRVCSMPTRSAISPTNGTLNPPVPHAKPIISDATVAALTGARDWPNVTLTGNVDCKNSPPIASTTTNSQPVRNGAMNRNGVDNTSESAITLRAPNLSAAGPPKNPPIPLAKRYAATDAPAWPTDSPRRVSITGTNVANVRDASVLRTTIEYSSARGLAYGRSAPNPRRVEGWSGISGTRRRKNATTARPGSASSGVHSNPNRCANGAKHKGPNENPSVPPVM